MTQAPVAKPPARDVDDRYTRTEGKVFLSGIQALVRLTLVQGWRDAAQGILSAGFISGYRGSPLGGLDEAFVAARGPLERNDIFFQPGVNEDLAATAVWGTQQVGLIGDARVDGVYAMWYGKSPGVDRCGDVFKHANHAGTSRHGGVLLVAGDDHGAYSSTLANQSDQIFSACMIPWLYPCNVEEYIELGLHGWAMSRFSGCLVGFKALADTVESSASVDADPMRATTVWPDDAAFAAGARHARLSAEPLGLQARRQEALLHEHKLEAALAYARVNRLNRVTFEAPGARFGIAASGKSYADTVEALAQLDIDEHTASVIGVRLFKVSMPWPLEPQSLACFARGLEELLVIEEKRPVIESQAKELLYGLPAGERPRIVGKNADAAIESPTHLLPGIGDFSVDQIVRVIASRLAPFHTTERIRRRIAELDAEEQRLGTRRAVEERTAHYCSGCPHSASTKVPEGSVALAGIGCHVMATAISPESNKTMTHMGGEGVTWIGQARFSRRTHVFANLGDGTYHHSGHLAIRAAVAAKVNITYKILYNDAVAMTGGQAVDGPLSVAAVAHQVAAEGVSRIAIVSDDPSRHGLAERLPRTATVHARAEFDAVQRKLRQHGGVTVLIYDQACAAEKRRRRRAGTLAAPARRLYINEAVCEGCGDCGVQSGCASLMPVHTDTGRKRQVDQSSCNLDHACADGFCPSFVSVIGGRLRRPRIDADALAESWTAPVAPTVPEAFERYNILVAGIGGTGVVTLGAWLGLAAHLEGKAVCVLDMTGMSQKNGAVTSHVRLAGPPRTIAAQRIPIGEADLVIGCDLLVAGSTKVIRAMRRGRTRAILNAHQQSTGRFTRDADWQFPDAEIRRAIHDAIGGTAEYLDTTRLAHAVLGDATSANALLLGICWQAGLIPLRETSLLTAMEQHGVAPTANQRAFAWGRRIRANPQAAAALLSPSSPVHVHLLEPVTTLVADRARRLAAYQDEAYARDFVEFISTVRRRCEPLGTRGHELVRAVATGLFKLMAYKDEYEVARLFTNGQFRQRLEDVFEGPFTLRFHVALPFLRRRGGAPASKGVFGGWLWHLLRLLAPLKVLRGTVLDPFGRQAERRAERALILWYRQAVADLVPTLSADNIGIALEIARLPESIRGYGHVKAASIELAGRRLHELQSQLHAVDAAPLAGAAG